MSDDLERPTDWASVLRRSKRETKQWSGPHMLGLIGEGYCEDCEGGQSCCLRLFRNPFAVFAERENWPDRLSRFTQRELCRRWAFSHFHGSLDGFPGWRDRGMQGPRHPGCLDYANASDHGGGLHGGERALAEWGEIWPLPIGTRALEMEAACGAFSSEAEPIRLANLMPFDGWVWAALIITYKAAETEITFFACVAPEDIEEARTTGKASFIPQRPRFLVRGDQPTEASIENFAQNTARWWTDFDSGELTTGRPRGSVDRDLRWYRMKLWEYSDHAAQRREKPTQLGFLAFAGLDRSTLKRNLKAWNSWPWGVFVTDALEERRHKGF